MQENKQTTKQERVAQKLDIIGRELEQLKVELEAFRAKVVRALLSEEEKE
jgi:hypothetical protein